MPVTRDNAVADWHNKETHLAFTNRSVFNWLTQTGNIHLHGNYLQLIHDSFLFCTPSGYDLAVAGGDILPLHTEPRNTFPIRFTSFGKY